MNRLTFFINLRVEHVGRSGHHAIATAAAVQPEEYRRGGCGADRSREYRRGAYGEEYRRGGRAHGEEYRRGGRAYGDKYRRGGRVYGE